MPTEPTSNQAHTGMAERDTLIPVPVPILRVWAETADTVSLMLDTEPLGAKYGFEPGQFNMLYAFGIGDVPISISGDPNDRGHLMHTVRRVGAVTEALAALETGDTVGLRGPFGTAWPVTEAAGKDVLIIAGGLGLAPIRPVLYRCLSERNRFGRIILVMGAREPDLILYRDEIHTWQSDDRLEVLLTVDRAEPAWTGDIGPVTNLISKIDLRPAHTLAMVCGPELMMRLVVRVLLEHDIELEQISLSMERNMKCAVGLCGHCQFGPDFVCKDGPVFLASRVFQRMTTREI